MAAVEVTISGILYDKLNRTTQNVVLIGEATLTGLGIGGGPIIPPENKPPDFIPGLKPEHPIMLPGMPGWPTDPPPQIPPPGSPPVVINVGDHVTQPIVVPPAIIVNYPGIGPVLVPKPVQGPTTTPPAKK